MDWHMFFIYYVPTLASGAFAIFFLRTDSTLFQFGKIPKAIDVFLCIFPFVIIPPIFFTGYFGEVYTQGFNPLLIIIACGLPMSLLAYGRLSMKAHSAALLPVGIAALGCGLTLLLFIVVVVFYFVMGGKIG